MLLSKVHLFHSQFEIMKDTSLSACEDHGRVESSLSLQSPWVNVSWDLARTLASSQDTEHVPLPKWEGFLCISTFLHGATEHCFPPGCCSSWVYSARVILQEHCAARCALPGGFEHTELKHKKGTLYIYGWFMAYFL